MKVIVIGGTGRTGSAMVKYFSAHHEVLPFDRSRLDLRDLDSIGPALADCDFDHLINCAAFTDVEACETNRETAELINAEVPLRLGAVCRDRGARFVHLGTDYVFDGRTDVPYDEESSAIPISAYGETKLRGEEGVLEQDSNALVLRTSLLFSMRSTGFPDWVIERALEGRDPIPAVADKVANLTRAEGLPILADQLLSRPDKAHGLYNLVHSEHTSAADQARYILERAAAHHLPLQTTEVRETSIVDLYRGRAQRPAFSALSNEKFTAATGKRPASWKEAVDAHIELIAPRYRD